MAPGADGELTAFAQTAVNIAVLLIATLGAAIGYWRQPGRKGASIEAQVVGGALADRQSMEMLADAIRDHSEKMNKSSEFLEGIASSLRRLTEEAERVGRTQDRVAVAIERNRPPFTAGG